jgi:hypothetical protein
MSDTKLLASGVTKAGTYPAVSFAAGTYVSVTAAMQTTGEYAYAAFDVLDAAGNVVASGEASGNAPPRVIQNIKSRSTQYSLRVNQMQGGVLNVAATVTLEINDVAGNPVISIGNNRLIVNPLDFGAVFDGETDDTIPIEQANIAARDGYGTLVLPDGIAICQYFNLYKGVKYEGVGIGQKTGGVGTTIKLKNGTNPTTGLVRKGTPDASGYLVENIVFDGNKSGNTSGHTLYIYQSESGGALGGDKDDYSIFRNVWLKDAPQNNIHIDGDGTVSNVYYNVRALRMYEIVSVGANGFGWYANRFTDSDVDGVTLYGNKMGAMNWNLSANILLKKAKGFYNGQSITDSSESFKFNEVRRSYFEIEAQEEYYAGISLDGCTSITADLFADACGYPSTSAVYGVRLKNCDSSSIRIKADSFHANDTVPFLQNQPLYLTNTNNVKSLQIELTYINQNVAPFYDMGSVDVSSMLVIENGKIQSFSSTVGAIGDSQITISPRAGESGKTQIYHTKGGSDSDNLYFDVKGSSTSSKTINLFRTTNSTANCSLTIFKANNTGTAQHRLNANGTGNAELCIGGGGWNTGHISLGSYRLWVDSSGRLRIKSSAPTSDTDGVVVGTQT